MEKNDIEKVAQIYEAMLHSFDEVLIGESNVKKIITSAMLCDTNSRILLTGNTGTGKTSLTNYLASSFNSKRISVTSDMIPSDIQEELKDNKKMSFLQIDEFNRASGKVQSTFIELFAENQMNFGGEKYSFNDFYVFATQNSADIAGVFNVPQAVYDRFDINVYFDALTEDEKRELLFRGFEPAKKSHINLADIEFTKKAVSSFTTNEKDEDIMMQIFELIDDMKLDGKSLFAGSNIRAHKFALKLAKLQALASGRYYLLPCDISDFINYLYKHRIDQNITISNEDDINNRFYDTQKQILSLKRSKF